MYVRAARTSLLRAVRIGCTGQLAPGVTHCTYAVRVPASGVLYAPRTVAPQVAECQCVTLAEAGGLPAVPPAILIREYEALLRTVSVLGNGSSGARPVATDVRSDRRERLESD